MSALLAFGGPWNEQVIGVPDDRPVVLAAVDPRPASYLAHSRSAGYDDTAPSHHTVTYRVERLGFHDSRRCIPGPPDFHGDNCRWVGSCLVADGYPHHRIEDQMNAIFALCSWSWPFGPIR